MVDSRSPEEAFDKVASDIRVAIIEAFADYRRAELTGGELPDRHALPITLSFTDIMDRVGVEDSGKFNYHLQELLGSFVTKDDDGYRLTMAGRAIAGSILSGAYSGRTIEPTTIDSACPRCGNALRAAYREGRFTVECATDHRMLSSVLPTGAVEGRSVTELLALATHRQRHVFSLLRESTCPFCYGPVSAIAGPTDLVKGDEYGVEAVCERCGQLFAGDFEMYLWTLPSLVTFYADHGIALQSRYIWEVRAAQDGREVSVDAETPRQVSFRVELDDETFVATLDESATVVETHRLNG